MTRQAIDRAALLTGARSRGSGSAASNPLLPAAAADPFTARPIDPATVTGTDAERLAVFERAIEQATEQAGESLRAAKARFAIEAGTALRAIQAGSLYLAAGHVSFEAYAKARWDMSRSRAYQLMDAAPVMAVVSKILDTAPVESQAVAVAPVLAQHGEDAVRKVMDAAREQSGKVTAAAIREQARRLGYIPEQDAEQGRQEPDDDARAAAAVVKLHQAVTALQRVQRELNTGVLALGHRPRFAADAERCRELAQQAQAIAQGIAHSAELAARAQ